MAITLFGSASTPTDNNSSADDHTIVTPPGSMAIGDLVFMTAVSITDSVTPVISEAGGQTWTSLTVRNQTSNSARSFWCVFNGTWSADPSVVFGATTGNTARMLVFRPSGGVSSLWEVDVAESSGLYAAPGSPYAVTITGITTKHDGALVIAGWTSSDNNTWGSLTAGWTALSPTQVRNLAGSDSSMTHAWMIDAVAGATGNVSQTQTAYEPDAGTYIIMSFHEIAQAVRANYLHARRDRMNTKGVSKQNSLA